MAYKSLYDACYAIIHEKVNIHPTSLLKYTNDIDLQEKIKNLGSVAFSYHFLKNSWEKPQCCVCNLYPTKWNPALRNYSFTCSKVCQKANVQTVVKRTSTIKQKYGVDNISQLSAVKEKKKETTLKNFGVEHPSQSEIVKNKQKQTSIERYGVEFALQNKKTREKIKKTVKDRYGVENISLIPQISEKKKKTNLSKYGVEHPFQSQEIKNKVKNSLFQRYGVTNPSQLDQVQQLKKQRSQIRHGVIHPSQSLAVKEKRKRTWITKYKTFGTFNNPELAKKAAKVIWDKLGVLSPMQSQTIKDKIKDTNLKKYGVTHPSKNSLIQEKIRKTNSQKYGSEYFFASKIGKQKIKERFLEKYNATNPMFVDEFKTKIKQSLMKNHGVTNLNHIGKSDNTIKFLSEEHYFKEMISNKSVFEICQEFDVSQSTVYKLINSYDCWDLIDTKESSYESKIKDLLERNKVKYIQNTRQVIAPYELDIFIPDHNLAIETGSAYWHSESYHSDKNYHLTKWSMCKKLNINLLQFFDDDLHQNWHLTESKILRLLKLSKVPVIGARKLNIVKLSHLDLVTFFQNWHVKKNAPIYHFAYGLQNHDELVAALTLRLSNNEIFIERFATNINFSFPGAFSRLLNYFVKTENFKGIIKTWSDNRLGDGNVYAKSGFIETTVSKPGYWYFKNKGLENRVNYQRHKLQKIFNLTDEENRKELSEYDIMKSKGYDRIWDAGHTLWLKEIK